MLHVANYDPVRWSIARERAAAMPIYAGSHRGEEANEVGALGEVLFESWLSKHGVEFVSRYVTTEDLLVHGDTIDIKTKDRTVRPLPHYDCSVPLYNHEHQRPTLYVFVSLQRDRNDPRRDLSRFQKGYLLGWCPLERMDHGTLWRANEVDPANGTRFWTDCRNVYVSDLCSMESLLERYKRAVT